MAGRKSKYSSENSNTKGTKIWSVAVYIRLSQEDSNNGEDKQESNSITSQKALLNEFIEEHDDLIVYDTYVDDGYTGTDFNRPGFQRLLEDMRKGNINCVLVKDLSRLGRERLGVGHYTEIYFPEHNVRYIALLDNIDTYFDAGMNDMAPFKGVINDMYVRDISKKIRSSLIERKKAGNFLGVTAPYGYEKDSNNKFHLVINEKEAEIVKRVFRLYLEGNGLTRIAQILTKDGVPVPGESRNIGKTRKTALYSSWKQTTIRRILDNRVYLGELVQFKRRKINYKSKRRITVPEEERYICKGTHEAIIDEESFNAVQNILKKNKSFKGTKHDYLFKGLLFCSECGARLNVTYSNYALKKYGEYRYTTICYSYSRLYSDICTRHSNSIPELEEVLIKHIKEVCSRYINENLQDELINMAKKQKQLELKQISNEKRLETLEQKISDIGLYIKNLYMDKVKGVVNENDYISLVADFTKDKDNLIKEKEELIKIINNQKPQINETAKIERLAKDFLSLERPTKQLLNELIEKITISENKEINIYFKFNKLNEIKKKIA